MTNFSSIPITQQDPTRADLYYYLALILYCGEAIHTDLYPDDCHATFYIDNSAAATHLCGARLQASDKTWSRHLKSCPHVINLNATDVSLVEVDQLARLYEELLTLPIITRCGVLKTYIYFVYWCGFYGDRAFHVTIEKLSADLGYNLNAAVRHTKWLMDHHFINRIGKYCFGNERNVSYRYTLCEEKVA